MSRTKMPSQRVPMDDEKNLILDRPMTGKSIEQIKKHTLDSTYEDKPVERALYLLTKGDDIQKLSIIQALPQLVKIDQHATFSRIVPKIQQELPKASSEFQVTTSQIFRILIETEVPVNLLGAVVQGVDSRDPIVSTAWMQTLLAVIPLLSEDVIKNEILQLIVNKSQLAQPVIQRVACCRIIGKLAKHKNLKPNDIKKDVLPFVLSLCQDCSAEVRAVMCTQLPFVAEGMRTGIAKTQLFPCFVELVSDNSALVREAAILTFVNMFSYIDEDTIKGTMVPLIKKFCEKMIPEDSIAAIVASQIGTIAEHTLPCLTQEDKLWFLQFYKNLAHRGFEARLGGADATKDVICRDNCAVNLPEMAKFVKVAIPAHMDVLYSIFRDLAADPCYIVRRSVAACLHEIAMILGNQNKLLKADFVRLLRDDAEDVLQMLVPNLTETLLLLTQFGLLSKERTDQCTMEISRAMLKCQIELSKSYNWRLLTMFLQQLECLPKCMPCEFIHQHFTPMVLANAANGRAKPVRLQATRTLLIFLRFNNKENQQKWLRDALVTQFCYSDSCYTRQIFITLCIHAIEVFSSKYFKQHFFMPLVSLADDPVASVRYSFINVMPKLKLVTLLPPQEAKYKILLQDAIAKLDAKEKKTFVLENLKRVCRELLNTTLANNKEFCARDAVKQEEENAEKAGEKQVGSITANQNLKPKLAGPTPSVSASKRRSLTVPVNNSKPPAPPNNKTIDMNFLEHHFYIDAGVNLQDAFNSEEESELNNSKACGDTSLILDGTKKLSLEANSKSSLNMTDDVKVNLRKMSGRIIPPPRTMSCSNIAVAAVGNNKANDKLKRHSSIFSSACMDEHDRKLRNRRSLNISGRDFSKIPVCTMKRETELLQSGNNNKAKFNNNSDDESKKENNVAAKNSNVASSKPNSTSKGSNLPLAIRKPNK